MRVVCLGNIFFLVKGWVRIMYLIGEGGVLRRFVFVVVGFCERFLLRLCIGLCMMGYYGCILDGVDVLWICCGCLGGGLFGVYDWCGVWWVIVCVGGDFMLFGCVVVCWLGCCVVVGWDRLRVYGE
jgi:hypothetical protein